MIYKLYLASFQYHQSILSFYSRQVKIDTQLKDSIKFVIMQRILSQLYKHNMEILLEVTQLQVGTEMEHIHQIQLKVHFYFL
jgi:hypothetical protein